MDALTGFIGKVVDLIIQPLVALLVTAGVAYFIWGVAVYIWNDASSDERAKGAQRMLWGIIGILIMVTVIGILNVVTSTFGVSLPGR